MLKNDFEFFFLLNEDKKIPFKEDVKKEMSYNDMIAKIEINIKTDFSFVFATYNT